MNLPYPQPTPTNISCLLIATLYSIGASWSLQHYCLFQLYEQCYLFTKDFSPFMRSTLYYLLLSFPVLIFTLSSLTFLPNSTGIELCLETDSFQMLVIFGCVVYAEESRQTVLEGFLVLRDALVYGGLLGFLGWIGMERRLEGYYGAVLIACFMAWWVVNGINSTLQYRVMKLLNLLNDERVVSSELLLTQQPCRRDINELQDIITDNQPLIEQQIQKFTLLLNRAVSKQRQRRIHQNFATVVLSFKTAIELQRQTQKKHRADIYKRFWLPRQQQYYSQPCIVGRQEEEGEQIAQTSQCDAMSDKVEEVEEVVEGAAGFGVMKWVYFPVYLLSLAKGRVKYVSYMAGVLMMVAVMFFLNYTCQYLGTLSVVNPNLITMLLAPLLSLSKLRYFLKLPGHSDYDFCNIFLQMGIVKLSLVVGGGLLLNSFVAGDFQRGRMTTFVCSKAAVLVGFVVVLCVKKIVARRQNFKYLMGVYLGGFAAGLAVWAI